jgi:high-affinity iron transporter
MGKALILDGANAWWAVFAFVFFIVSREGMESAAMLSALAANSELRHLLAGGLMGLAGAAAVALLWTEFGRQVNLSRFFNVTVVFMLVFAVMLVLKGFYEFTEVNLMPGIDNRFWHQASAPYVEGSYAQVASMLLVLAPTLWLIAAHWIDTKRGRTIFGSTA